MDVSMRGYKNRILASLPRADLERLTPHLSPVRLGFRTMLMDGLPPRHAYFLESGMASVVLPMADGSTAEVGVVGKDGLVGLPILLGAKTIPGHTYVGVAADAYRIDAQCLREEFERPGAFRQNLEKYLLASLRQGEQNVACNRLHGLTERLSRWLLTCRDRSDTDEMPLTHEFLSRVLGGPRSYLTETAGKLQLAGLIHYTRGRVRIMNRAGLEDVACECYHVVRGEFQRLGLL